ncbi:MAG: Rieske 2Fe-2S domain-containing protein [Myxococcota bacterium]
MSVRVLEFEGLATSPSDAPNVGSQLLQGDVVLLRGCMQALGLFDALRGASLEGIRRAAGDETARRVESEGFEALHRIVDAADLPAVTDAVYRVVADAAPDWLDGILHGALGVTRPFYFERQPNVRFLLPYDAAMGHGKAYQRFAKTHGEGKITPHGPHRDSWLDCPTNAVNVWIAVGPVKTGNGLSIFTDAYGVDLPYTPKGEITREVAPGRPLNFDMAPGDALLFHGDQLHASELNWTDETRHVVSFRLTLERPHFRDLQYHHYAHSGFRKGALRPLAELPASLSWKWLATRVRFLGRRLFGRSSAPAATTATAPAETGAAVELDANEIPVGALHPVSSRICATRLADGRVLAFARHCPHQGADLTRGFVEEGRIVCPWHNLHFDLESGRGPCQAMKGLRSHAVERDGDRVRIATASGGASV